MPKYRVQWTAFGSADVTADDPQTAMEMVTDGLFDIDPIDWDRADVDGTDLDADLDILEP